MRQGGDRLSPYQLTAVLISVIMGHRVITVGRTATRTAGEAGWLAVVLAALLSLTFVWVSARLTRLYEGKSFPAICRILLGPLPSAVLATALAGMWVVRAGLTVREFAEIVSITALFRTPYMVTVLSVLGAAAYLLLHSARVLGRVNELYWILAAAALVGAAAGCLPYARLYHLLPWYGRGLPAIAWGALSTFGDFGGFDTALVFMPLLDRPSAAWPAAARGVVGAGGVFLVLTLAGTATLGTEGLANLAWPTLQMVKMARIPGRLLERLDAIFISVGVTAIFATASVYLFAALLVLREAYRPHGRAALPLFLAGLALVVAVAPPDLGTLFQWLALVDRSLWFSGVAVPTGLWLLARLRGGSRGR